MSTSTKVREGMVPHKGYRLGGYLIDGALMYLAQTSGAYLGVVVMTVIGYFAGAPGPILEKMAGKGLAWGWLFWGVAFWILNFGYLQGVTGSSLGKLICGTRVIGVDGRPPGILRSLARSFCYLFSQIPFMLGFLTIFWDRESRCIHDHICGTYVVKKKTKPQLVTPAVIPLPSPPVQEEKTGTLG